MREERRENGRWIEQLRQREGHQGGERYWGNRAIERYRQRERQRDGEREVGHCCEDIYLSIYI